MLFLFLQNCGARTMGSFTGFLSLILRFLRKDQAKNPFSGIGHNVSGKVCLLEGLAQIGRAARP